MTNRTIHVVIDPDRCAGYANCLAAAPGVFTMGEDDVAHVLHSPYPEAEREVLERAVSLCPAKAISLHVGL